ncbi:hypothetical protein BS47DRAFT_1348402, partial [Hydnum rufescens UP504]
MAAAPRICNTRHLVFPIVLCHSWNADGAITTVIIGLITLYTSRVLWVYCMRFSYTRDICDVAF